MSPEFLSAIAAAGTFVVIAATAIVAIVQLHHLRSSNQIAILTEFREELEGPEFLTSLQLARELNARLDDPNVRAEFRQDPLPPSIRHFNTVVRLYETLGCFVKRGILAADLVCDLWAPVVWRTWETMAAAIVIARRTRGAALAENFEYLAFLSSRWMKDHPTAYPKGAPRIAPEDKWLTLDAAEK